MAIDSHPLYHVWCQIRYRCYEKSNKDYRFYGGRGITVCERWMIHGNGIGFRNFIADMGDRPINGQVERVNNDKGYSPDNCIWATREEQSKNRRTNRRIKFNGEENILMDWSKKVGISSSCIAYRLNVGWSVKRALTTPTYRESRTK